MASLAVVELGTSGWMDTAHHPKSIKVCHAHPAEIAYFSNRERSLSTNCVTPTDTIVIIGKTMPLARISFKTC
jgi:hypothetical protein